MREGIMPFVQVFTREKLSDEIRAKLAEELSNTIMVKPADLLAYIPDLIERGKRSIRQLMASLG
jgi:hypothetical protein